MVLQSVWQTIRKRQFMMRYPVALTSCAGSVTCRLSTLPKSLARSRISKYFRSVILRSPSCHKMISATDSAFLGVLENWFRSRPEILVLIRYSRAAGRKEFEFFFSYESLVGRLSQLPPSTSVIAFHEPQLPLRGVVDADFISTCLNALPENSEFLVLETR